MHSLVLIHGFPYDSSMWQHQAEHLRAVGHTVITPDLPGFGGGGKAPAEISIEQYADHVHKIIEKDAGGKAIVGGFSMGGYTLLELLNKYPGDVAAAMFIDTRPDGDSNEAHVARMNAAFDLQFRGNANLIESSLAKQFSNSASMESKNLARAIMQKQPVPTLSTALFAMTHRRDHTELLPQINVPTLILVGEEDSITPPAVALNMNMKIPNSVLLEIPRAGHMTPLEQPQLVSDFIEKFVAKVK